MSQVKVGRIVEQLEHLIDAEVLRSQLLLKRHSVEHAPERPLLFRELAQLFFVGTDADIFDAIELHRGMACCLNLQNHYRLAVGGGKFEKAEVNLWRGFLQQPTFQLLLLVAGGRGLEGRADHRMTGIVDTLQQITILLAEQGGGIGQRRDVFTNQWHVIVTLLELYPFGFLLEFGISLPQGQAVIKRLSDVLAEHELPVRLTALLQRLDEQVTGLDKELAGQLADDDLGRRLLSMPCVGPITASLLMRRYSNVVACALANKLARIAGAIATHHSQYEAGPEALSA